MKRRVLNLLIALDQLAWVILTFGNGMPDETISAAFPQDTMREEINQLKSQLKGA